MERVTLMPDSPEMPTPEQDAKFHTYTTHRIPWYVRAIWIGFWIGAIWYVIKFAIPMAKTFYE